MTISVRVLNPHGLRVAEIWPTLRAINLKFKDCESLLAGNSLKLPLFQAGIVTRLVEDAGHSTEVLKC